MIYVSTADHAKQIRTTLKKEHGWTGQDVSVRTHNYSMGSSIYVTIKKRGIDKLLVEKIAKGHERISRCEYSGEILSGGNRFVSVDYDWEFLDAIKKEVKSEVDAAWAKAVESPGHAVDLMGWKVYCDENNRPRVYKEDSEDASERLWSSDTLVAWAAAQVAKGTLEVAK